MMGNEGVDSQATGSVLKVNSSSVSGSICNCRGLSEGEEWLRLKENPS